MKAFQIVLLLAGVTFTTAAFAQETKSTASPSAQQSPQTPATIGSAIDREITIVEKEVVDAAEAMPEEKYNFGASTFPAATTKGCAPSASN